MPRKALATARAALWFANRAADERGLASHRCRGTKGVHDMSIGTCAVNASASADNPLGSLSRQIATGTTNWRDAKQEMPNDGNPSKGIATVGTTPT